jgi:putative membrane protein
MLLAAQIFAVVAALLHLIFFAFETVFWSNPVVWKRFGITSQQQADTIRPMAYNQGFYNLALAVGLLVGVVLVVSEENRVAGRTLLVFASACMVLAGTVLAGTGRRYRRSAAIQFFPALLALGFTLAS